VTHAGGNDADPHLAGAGSDRHDVVGQVEFLVTDRTENCRSHQDLQLDSG
jgi:hypothetical protein